MLLRLGAQLALLPIVIASNANTARRAHAGGSHRPLSLFSRSRSLSLYRCPLLVSPASPAWAGRDDAWSGASRSIASKSSLGSDGPPAPEGPAPRGISEADVKKMVDNAVRHTLSSIVPTLLPDLSAMSARVDAVIEKLDQIDAAATAISESRKDFFKDFSEQLAAFSDSTESGFDRQEARFDDQDDTLESIRHITKAFSERFLLKFSADSSFTFVDASTFHFARADSLFQSLQSIEFKEALGPDAPAGDGGAGVADVDGTGATTSMRMQSGMPSFPGVSGQLEFVFNLAGDGPTRASSPAILNKLTVIEVLGTVPVSARTSRRSPSAHP